MLRALIFDVDGTLADTEELHRQAFNRAFAALGLDWSWSALQYKKLLEVSGGKERILYFITSRSYASSEAKELAARIPEIHQIKTQIYTDLLATGQLQLRPGIKRLILEARSAGLRLGIATTTTLDNVTALLNATLGLDSSGWFDVIGAGDMVMHKKPAPDIYELVLNKMAVESRDCIAFEDSVNGLHAALDAYLATVVTPTQWSDDHDFSGAAWVLPHLGDNDHPLDIDAGTLIGGFKVELSQLKYLLASRETSLYDAVAAGRR
jgi:HAD superfamily hydrolase (TIGR01509 family)